MLFAANSDPPTRMWQQKSRLIRAGNIFFKLLLSNCSEHVCKIGSVYCSVAVSMFSILRIYICLSRYLGLSTVDYLSCCCRPITLKQSGRSPPTTTRHFHTGNWMFSVKFSIKCIITAVDTLV